MCLKLHKTFSIINILPVPQYVICPSFFRKNLASLSERRGCRPIRGEWLKNEYLDAFLPIPLLLQLVVVFVAHKPWFRQMFPSQIVNHPTAASE